MTIEKDRFGGIARLYSEEGLRRLKAAKVMVVGVGGVGSWVAEALARSGVGHLVLVDYDDICVTNTNRQIHALQSTVGKMKTSVLSLRLKDINPSIELTVVEEPFSRDNSGELLGQGLSYVVDAIDSLKDKVHLIEQCFQKEIPIIVCGGAGGRVDPTCIQVGDLARTDGDKLLHKVKRQLRSDFGFPAGDPKPRRSKKFGLDAIYSNEIPRLPEVCEKPSGPLDCDTGYGTTTAVTGTFGFFAAARVCQDIAKTSSVSRSS